MADPVMDFDHGLDGLKGFPRDEQVDFHAQLSADVQVDPVWPGRVVSLNSDGEFKLGIANQEMPLFLINGSSSLDASNPGGRHWKAVKPRGVSLTAVVATGAYELASTEYDTSKTYAPNDTLTAVANQSSASVGGVLTNASAVPYVNPVCGVVSRGEISTGNATVLAFWPVYLPIARV